MKRIISIILALALAITLLPSVAFATEPHKIEYKFSLEEIGITDPNAKSQALAGYSAYPETCEWRFLAHTGTSARTVYKNILKASTSERKDENNVVVGSVSKAIVSLKIEVDKTAEYSAKIACEAVSAGFLGGVRFYIYDENTKRGNGWGDSGGALRDGLYYKYHPLDNATIDMCAGGEYEFKEKITLEKGSYYLVIFLDGNEETRTQINIKSFTLTETSAAADSKVSGNVGVGVSAYDGGSVSLMLEGEATDAIKSDVAAGTEFTAVATADDGYKFAYWKDSAGKVVSAEASYTFNAYTNTALVAVFDSEESGNAVEFFDADGNYLDRADGIADGTVFADVKKPKLENNNYAFIGWSIEDDTEIVGVMRAVAVVDVPESAIANVTVTTPTGTEKNVSYGQEFSVSSSSGDFGAWARNNRLISFDRDYTYYAFDSATINEINGLETKGAPIVILDTHNSADYADTYMLEYDATGKTIVEAGILFGDDTHNTVSSCYYKAKVRNIKEHGQFIARTPDDTSKTWNKARGYIIYRDGSDFAVKYSD